MSRGRARAQRLAAALALAAALGAAEPETPGAAAGTAADAAPGTAADATPGTAADATPAAAEAAPPDARELVRRAEEALRGRGSIVDATMSVYSRKGRRVREVALRVFDDRREDRALVRVLSPDEQAGLALLKLPPNLWLYSPETRETTRIPGSAWGESFLDGDFTRDDLVHGSDAADRYELRIAARDERAGEAGDRLAFVVEAVPRPELGSAWGRIVAWIDAEDATPLRLDYYTPDAALARTLRFEDVREVAGRRYPYRWVMRRSGAKGRETRIDVASVRFDPSFEPGVFTTRRLPVAPR